MSKTKHHIFEIHFLRAIACLLVVLVHVSGSYFHQQGQHFNEYTLFINQISRFGTPMFSLISAFLLTYQIRKKGFNLRRFVSSRFTKIGLPFLFWSIFYLLFMYLLNGENPFKFGIKPFLVNFAFGNSAYHLYFMSIVFQFYLLFLFLQRFRSKLSWTVLMSIAVMINIYFLNWFSPDQADGIWRVMLTQRAFLPNWIFYFIFGGFLAYYWEPLLSFSKKSKVFLSIAALFIILGAVWEYKLNGSISSNRTTNIINLPILTLFVMGIGSNITDLKWVNGFFAKIGTFSMAIYLVHPFVLFIFQEIAPAFVWKTSFFPIVFGVILATTILIIKGIQLIPGNQYILTVPRMKLPTQQT
ncbi:acyltransferase [Rossellomorea aquimaris]|uniref:acyltransferase n=1 Tax=Rossellomorea aquimaris TaxID=189382 RepID=UPI001CD27873|nr:acyltransferase [Rossellomorea aquimaris]MCA1060819.1 acyltransferase [Rossellomorea aquimaris]